MKLCEMAQEYRVNVALLELRIKQLQAAQKRTRQPEVALPAQAACKIPADADQREPSDRIPDGALPRPQRRR